MVDLDGVRVLITRIGLFGFLLLVIPASGQDVLVVTAERTGITSMTPFQVQQLFLGKLDRLDGKVVSPLHLRENDPLRKALESAIFEPGFDQRNYWLTQELLAEAEPPLTVGSWSLMLVYLARNPGYIGYVDADYEDELARYGLVVLLRLKAQDR